MTPEELKRVLNEHATYERNRDSVCVFLGGIILLTAGAIYYSAQWAWKRYNEKPYKPPCKPVRPHFKTKFPGRTVEAKETLGADRG